ncbi:Gfo/Idh/MocA family oxidoreductase [Cetobacterium sp. 2G large]|uniref:Gfo/Idh/MocA family oxidoreductase n=1 Tax=Cetobacterium sp. 2G large TaxID=2759680 RepID=UPI00163BA641|nr:Gfo/Idh/MocA family oxidoreductase [Cetobacterium sp. 2G large]MBC2852527.1 Gfo/Idh/MocA family oxidoreductase [Cetobacterium sp. 2G large]
MKKVLTYGTFDLFHEGHYNLLKRAKNQGEYLIVGVTTENYDKTRGKLNVQDSLMKRIEAVKATKLADEIIIEEFEGQKIQDILKYNIDKFVIGSDWRGKFDYLKEYCDVIYLERTKGISSTDLRAKKNNILKLGIVGCGRIANRFIPESKYVSGINVEGVFSLNEAKTKIFQEKFELEFMEINYDKFLEKVDAVYIASPHKTHFEYAKKALESGKHVLCEKPITMELKKAKELYDIAFKNGLVLLEAIKTAFSPGFIHLINIAKSGIIGEIKDIDATFTKLSVGNLRELDKNQDGGSVTELGTYPLLAIIKLLGKPKDIKFYSYKKDEIDLYTRIFLEYPNAIASAKVGLGVKSEGELIISGTKGYIYVPAPWWKTEYFEVRFENQSFNKKYFYKFEEDGLRYEISEFLELINRNSIETYKLTSKESLIICEIIEKFREQF